MSCIPDKKTTNKMYRLYKKGYSLSQIGEKFKVTRQTVWDRFKRAKKKLRPLVRKEFVEYKGNRYTLDKNGYYRKTNDNRSLLHRDIWESHHGVTNHLTHDIHHINEIKTDNRLENLQLLTKAEHTKLHNFLKLKMK